MQSLTRTSIGLIVSLAFWCAPSHSAAQAVPDEVARARWIRSAVVAQSQHDATHALEYAMRADEIRTSGTLRGFMARQQIDVEHFADALANLEQCVREAPTEPPTRTRDVILAWCESRVTDLRRQVAHVTIAFDSVAPPEGTVVLVQNRRVESRANAYNVAVDPGVVSIVVSAPDRASFSREISIESQQETTVRAVLAPMEPDAVPAPLSTSTRASHVPSLHHGVDLHPMRTVRTNVGWIVGAIGLTSALGGLAAAMAVTSLRAQSDPSCGLGCDVGGSNRNGSMLNALDWIANVGGWGGLGMMAIGGVLFATVTATRPESSVSHVRLDVGPSGIGLLGTF